MDDKGEALAARFDLPPTNGSPPAPAPDVPDELHQRFGELTERVEQLERSRRPWYLDPSTILGLLAFVLSTVVAVDTYRAREAQQLDDRHNELTTIIDKLNALDVETARIFGSEKSQDILERASLGLNNQRVSLLQSADRLVRSIGAGGVSPTELVILGASYFQIQNYDRAEQYVLDFLKVETDPLQRANGFRSLATVYFSLGPSRVPDGRKAYDDTVATLASIARPGATVMRTDTLAAWSRSELMFGNHAESLQRLMEARALVHETPCEPMRAFRAQSYDMQLGALAQIYPPARVAMAQPIARTGAACVFDAPVPNFAPNPGALFAPLQPAAGVP
jgi:hypothetical protein